MRCERGVNGAGGAGKKQMKGESTGRLRSSKRSEERSNLNDLSANQPLNQSGTNQGGPFRAGAVARSFWGRDVRSFIK